MIPRELVARRSRGRFEKDSAWRPLTRKPGSSLFAPRPSTFDARRGAGTVYRDPQNPTRRVTPKRQPCDRPGDSGLLRALVLTLNEIRYEAWEALVHSVKAGAPAFLLVFGARLFDYLDVDEDAGATFHEAISNVSPLQRGAHRGEVLAA